MFFLTSLMLIAVFSNIILACATNFTCSVFLPTLTYLGCFRGHDRLFIAAATYYGTVLPLVFIGGYSNFKPVMSETQRNVMLKLGLVLSAVLPLIAITDEVNGVHIIPLEPVNNALSIFFIMGSFTWVYFGFRSIQKMSESFNENEKFWYKVLRGIVIVLIGMVIVTIIEWKFCYSQYSGEWVNEHIESICEWIIMIIFIVLPTVFCQFYRGFSLSFTVESSNKETKIIEEA